VFITDIHTLGLEATQGMLLTDSWYWNRDAGTRAWSQRFMAEVKRMPTSIQAGNYSAVLSYLAAVQAAGTTEGAQVMTQLRQRPVDDMFAKGRVRADGSMVHDMYLMQVKTPAESTGPWDYYKIVATIPGDDAFTTQKESRCAAWK
jgi:branched-chain amino acid transport system substrate-binding protein